MATRIEKIYPAIIPPTSKQLDRLYGHISNQRGVASEKLADSVLDFLINQGRLIHCWWPSDPNEVRRGIGIDRKVVRQADGMVVDIQIKASEIGAYKHLLSHPDVPCCVVIQPEWPFEKAVQELETAIAAAPYSLL